MGKGPGPEGQEGPGGARMSDTTLPLPPAQPPGEEGEDAWESEWLGSFSPHTPGCIVPTNRTAGGSSGEGHCGGLSGSVSRTFFQELGGCLLRGHGRVLCPPSPFTSVPPSSLKRLCSETVHESVKYDVRTERKNKRMEQ